LNSVLILLKRDVKNSINKRFYFLLALMLVFQLWFVLSSGSVDQVKESGQMVYMAAVFSFNFLGSIVALALNYNGMSKERESKFLDLVLTSGVSKGKVFFSKVMANFLASGAFASLYVLVLAIVYFASTGDFALSLLTFRYLLPIMAFLSIFSLMGLMLSIMLRSSNASLITSIVIGALLMPRLFVMMIDGLGSLFALSQSVSDIISMISPALIMNALSGYSGTGIALWGVLLLVVYLASLMIKGAVTFVRQDELNYGE